MPSERPSGHGERNLLIAVAFLAVTAGLTAFGAAWIAGFVLDKTGDSNAMALLIGANRVASDSADLERHLNSAQTALKSVRDLGWAMSIGCLGVAFAVGVRVFRRPDEQNAS
jgi:hypothetical protein